MLLRSTSIGAIVLALAGCKGGALSDTADHTDTGAPTDPPTDVETEDSARDTEDTEVTDTGDVVGSREGLWLRDEFASPGSISFSELHYHPAGDDDLEWLELHNPMALDLDLTGWTLGDGVRYAFPDATVLPAGGYLVVAADPPLLAGETGFTEALGPYNGQLANGGERIELIDNAGRRIDSIRYGDDDPWPVGPDGSGFTLTKTDPDAASDRAEHWAVSATLGGTPGQAGLIDPSAPPVTLELVPRDATWRYDASGAYPAADWAASTYDDSAWAPGEAPFYVGAALADTPATILATADNHYALYLGQADGSDLTLVAEDADGSWTTVDAFDVVVRPTDHLFVAAWEAPGDSGSPQMVIAEIELPSTTIGTDAAAFEWVLGPTDANPGASPPAPAPDAADLAALIADADASGWWAAPAVDADRFTSPWGATVGGGFTDAARFVWGDTFDSASVTNTEETYALFRSRDRMLGPGGTTELPALPTTATFRTPFTFTGDPAWTTLALACELDDGAVVYLNGVEVHRENLPAGPVTAATLATAPVDGLELFTAISADPLVAGANVLAVELHQAENPDEDLFFACSLTATVSPETLGPTVVLHEIAPAADPAFWVELDNVSGSTWALDDLVLASSGGGELALTGELAPGELRVLDDLGLTVEAGDVLFLYGADRGALLDAVRVLEPLRGRDGAGGPWRYPSAPTPGEPNTVDHHEDVVIHEIQYHRSPLSSEGEPVVDRDEEWIELFNRGATPQDLSGWKLVDAVAYAFPDGTELAPGGHLVIARDADALRAAYPSAEVLGDFDGRLDNQTDRILLLDAMGNPADEVRYHDGGRWPEAADGGGSSLELRDPWADNSAPEAWAASDEGARSAWVDVRYRGVAESSPVGPDGVWEELVIGLLDAGEVLVDDLSVVEDPDGAAIELVTNGGFDSGSAPWRLLGTHRHSEVVPDPDDASNPVLRLIATGATGHMHDHAELTLARDITRTEYEISYRARAISGSNQLNTRLYFNRLPRTTRIDQPEQSGTPGATNSTAIDNLGPTFTTLQQDVAVPAAYQPVELTIDVQDPDGVAAVTVWASVDGAAFVDAPMAEVAPGRWRALLDGQAAGAIVQLYVEAVDGAGARATFPAAGPDSRALLTFDDGRAATNGLHNLRILMTAEDVAWLHDDVNLMSNDPLGATVVYDETEVFYDVGVRAKGSERGRPTTSRLGYGLRFHAEQLFRGSHRSALVDRSEGVGYGQREVLLNLVQTHAGSISAEYNDLIQAITPLPEHTGAAELQLDRSTGLVLGAQFADGGDGTVFEYELIYYPLTTDDGTDEGAKLPQPDSVIGTAITDLGDETEDYRHNFLIASREIEDDYARLIELAKTFALPDSEFRAQAADVIDVDAWLRAFAFATLAGVVDQYGGDGSQHNARLYVRPSDQRVLYFPHDLDFFGSSTMSVVGNNDLRRLIADPVNARTYYGHLVDILDRAYNPTHLAPWCDQLAALLPAQPIASHCAFIADRADWVMYDASDAVLTAMPLVEFAITTAGGADFSVKASEAVLEGTGWVDVYAIAWDGAPLAVSWLDAQTWQVTLPLAPGANSVDLVATDRQGAVVGSDAIVVTSTGG